MHSIKIRLKSLLLGILSCFLVIGLSSPVLGITSQAIGFSQNREARSPIHAGLNKEIDTNLQVAKSVLLAQGMSESSLKTYVAVMSPDNVVPNSPNTSAGGVVGAVLAGDRLVVRGSFRDLSSAMRDYASDPTDPPNPNITSAFHIHRGMSSENGPFQYALTVMMNDSGRGGSAMGDYTLTPEQREALDNGMLYVDLHTTRYRTGELRAALMPS